MCRFQVSSLVLLAGVTACAGGGDGPADTDGSTSDSTTAVGTDGTGGTTTTTSASATNTASASDSATTSTSSTTTDTTTDSTTGTTGEPPTSTWCEDRELPPRDGIDIVVTPGQNGMVTVDGNSMTLRQAVNMASSGDTVLLEDGTYTFPEGGPGSYTGIFITTADITVRSQSGNAANVILDSAYLSHGDQTAPITIDAPGVVVADLTVQESIFHLIHIWANGDDAIIHNVRMVDGGQQFMKASPGNGTVDGVEVSCSQFLMTENGRDNVWGYGPQDGGTKCYTGGIDTHDATNWHVHRSYFDGIYCDATGVQRPAHGKYPELRNGMTYNGGLAEHGIHMWDSAQGTGHRIEQNRVVNCARGIGIGLQGVVYGSTVVNNMVFSEHAGSGQHDVGIIVERAVDTLVAHNTVHFSHANAYSNAIEYRWDTTQNLTLHGNLTNQGITARNGATAALSDNVEDAMGGWYVDEASGDLHLADCSGPGSSALSSEVSQDHDGDMRSDPTVPGADECAP